MCHMPKKVIMYLMIFFLWFRCASSLSDHLESMNDKLNALEIDRITHHLRYSLSYCQIAVSPFHMCYHVKFSDIILIGPGEHSYWNVLLPHVDITLMHASVAYNCSSEPVFPLWRLFPQIIMRLKLQSTEKEWEKISHDHFPSQWDAN